MDTIAAAIVSPFQPWQCCATAPGAITSPDQLAGVRDWLPAQIPGTAASALHAAGRWQLGEPHDFDAEDWWFRTTFSHPGSGCELRCDGLASIAEVWLNGHRLGTTSNMFRRHAWDATPWLRKENELAIAFRSVTEELKKKRARPRWKTGLVSHQQLRWLRTTLLGRIPGWSPPVAPVGPWRGVHLDINPIVTERQLTTSLVDGDGMIRLQGRVRSEATLRAARLHVGDMAMTLNVQREGDRWRVEGEWRVSQPALWWPHTHGSPTLYSCRLELTTSTGTTQIDCGNVGFRRLEVRQDPGFGITVNGTPIYCRGACWTVSDIVSLGDANLDRDLRLARDAGVNMLRVGGTMVYENERFYALCDELGIMVWQDFMFANMDYPLDDPAFVADVETEVRGQLARLAAHPSVAVFCGNSEIEQQAAMLGVARELWRHPWFGSRLPELCGELAPETAYVPSTPSGGVLPFHGRDGVTHYYGVGAYLRSPAELRRADVKFTPECLGFSQIPEPTTIVSLLDRDVPIVHQPRWKERVPRDSGAGWDFEDVRDFYLRQLFAVDPAALRSFDAERYLQLSRVVPGEMMSQVFAEWRGGHSRNQGALVWFFKDLWPGAGWGIVDSLGQPKAAYYYLKRSWQPRQLTITDEGLDGLHLHVVNETATPLVGHVELILLHDGVTTVARGSAPCVIPPHRRQMLAADALLGSFYDVTYAYRFGPPKHDIVMATLRDDAGHVVSEAFHFVAAREPLVHSAIKFDAVARQVDDRRYLVELESDRFLHAVRFDVPGYRPDDNYFHLPPGRRKTVNFTAEEPTRFRLSVDALNLRQPLLVRGPDR